MSSEEPSMDPKDFLFESEDLPEDHRSGFVAVIGRPNVGKSTLLNRLLGQKIAITSPKPQTTRDRILGILTRPDAQFIFLDTPGIHQPQHKLGAYMVSVAEKTIRQDADLVLWLVDVNLPPTEEDRLIGARLQELHGISPIPPLLLGLNKADLWQGSAQELEERRSAYLALAQGLAGAGLQEQYGAGSAGEVPPVDSLAFSALSGQSVEDLLAMLRKMIPTGPRFFPPDQVTDLQTRFIVAELVREEALNHLKQEVPHSIAVTVEEFQERSDHMTYVAATLYVERSSQKKIVLGHQGTMIKQIGKAARLQIEELLGTKVYLDLWVKTWENWRKKESRLRYLGYRSPDR